MDPERNATYGFQPQFGFRNFRGTFRCFEKLKINSSTFVLNFWVTKILFFAAQQTSTPRIYFQNFYKKVRWLKFIAMVVVNKQAYYCRKKCNPKTSQNL